MPQPIDQKVYTYVSQVRSTVLRTLQHYNIDTNTIQLRSINDVLSTNSFTIPPSIDQIVPRIKHNLTYYTANYLLVYVGALLLLSFFHPQIGLLLVTTLLINSYVWCIRTDPLLIGATKLGLMETRYSSTVVTFGILFYVASTQLLHTMFYSSIIIILHSVVRNQSITHRATNAANNVAAQFR